MFRMYLLDGGSFRMMCRYKEFFLNVEMCQLDDVRFNATELLSGKVEFKIVVSNGSMLVLTL